MGSVIHIKTADEKLWQLLDAKANNRKYNLGISLDTKIEQTWTQCRAYTTCSLFYWLDRGGKVVLVEMEKLKYESTTSLELIDAALIVLLNDYADFFNVSSLHLDDADVDSLLWEFEDLKYKTVFYSAIKEAMDSGFQNTTPLKNTFSEAVRELLPTDNNKSKSFDTAYDIFAQVIKPLVYADLSTRFIDDLLQVTRKMTITALENWLTDKAREYSIEPQAENAFSRVL
ncbi:hypothetical protein HF673_02700 [Acidithiobacillus thiooxidans]|uniref:hypothetical protein n=1 Tax=Acidithiobacillus thiooxidans TaxID=930 RepID=UPI001C07853A|nr:hypothetical protein [Acidithiobacillus thiooxidans]MBU2834717.1 hypothetical protein [Acidithiobacillus thiooxidans]